MTHLKKSLALFLALIMMFSSMSVAANAWTVNDDPNNITFTVKFFRESPKNSGNWIPTTNAAPGENVKARIYIETGYYTYGGESALVFDKDFFSSVGFENNVRRSLTVNTNYAGPSDDAYGAGQYNLEAEANWKNEESFGGWTTSNYDIDYILNEIEHDKNYFKTHDFISNNIEFGSGINNCKLSGDDWMYEFDFVVNNSTATNTVDESGEVKVPPYYFSKERTNEADLFINITKGEGGVYRTKNKGMWTWVPEFTTNPGTLTTTSKIVFDMGLVDEDGEWYEDTYTFEKGIISKEADLDAVTNPTRNDGMVFDYWSTDKPAEGVTQKKVSTISYDYDAKTLYAVWKEAPAVSYSYTLKEFYMNADGTYPSDVEGVTKSAESGTTVSAPASSDPLYTLDEKKSDFDVALNSDGSSVVNAYYERNKYNLVYHYEDMLGAQTDSYSVRFGAELPAFTATPSGEPVKTGYNFLGWTTTEGGTEVETLPTAMPTEDLHLYPVYEAVAFDFIFKAGEGTFSDGESMKRYTYSYGAEVIDPEIPAAPGKKFVDWDNDIPENAYKAMTFEAIYESGIYTVTFKADADNDGTYETVVKEVEFEYGEKLYPESAPATYPLDAWKLEDGTAVEISNAETTYTVTGDTVICTVGNGEYLADFYLTQEDYDNEVNPYYSVYVKYDKLIPVPENPDDEMPGYNFIVWEPDAQGGLLMDSKDGKKFLAVFEAKDITVTYDPNEGKCDAEPDTVKYGESITLPEATRDGYEFLGWLTPDKENVGKAGEEYAVPTENITLTADWKAEEHTITFLDDDGKELGKIEALTDDEISVPEKLNPPVKAGYEFTGWVNRAGEKVSVPATMPADDMVLTATWSKNSYDFNADANGGEFDNGEETISAKIPYGDGLKVEQPEWAGHKFLGWAYADDESNTIITLPETMPDKAISIKAVWDTNVHDVKYDANGGVFTNADGSTTGFREFKDVEYGTAIPALKEEPTRDGYTFEGWSPEAPDAMPDNDFTFTAVWEKIPDLEAVDYEIYISYPNPANPEETLETLVIKDSALPKTSVEVIKAGEDKTADKAHTYEEILAKVTVDGIEPDYNNRPEAIVVTENGGKIVVSFKLTEYTVEFNPNGGKFGTSEESVIVTGTWGQAVDAPENPTRKGYNFLAWDKTVPETFTENIVINATWEVQKHTATFIVKDETGKEVARIPVDYEYGATIVAPEYTAPEGYKFKGWDIPAGAVMGESDMEFTSTLEPITYELSYEISGLPANLGVEAPATQSGIRKGDKAPVAAAPVVAGYEFDGWYNGEDKYTADGTAVIEMPEGNVELKGTYTAKYSVITFDANGGQFLNGEHVYTVDAQVGTTFSAVPEDPTRNGYKFNGWTDVNGNPTSVPEVFPEEDVTIKAAWLELYDVTYYDADGKVFESFTDAGVEGTAIPVPADKPVKEGSVFAGWVDANGNSVNVIPAGNVELYPSWTSNKHTVTYNAGEGSFAAGKTVVYENVEYGAEIPVPEEIPVRDGFTFDRWAPEAPEAMPDNDLEFTAEWKENSAPSEATYTVYAVTYNPANPSEVIKVPVLTGSGVAGDTVEIIKAGESSEATHKHTYEEIVAKLASNSNEPDYDKAPATATLVAGENEILVDFKLIEFEIKFIGNGGYIVDENGIEQEEVTVKGYYGQPVNIPGDDRLDREGFDFTGWDATPGETFTENATYNATWEIQIHDIDFIVVDENGDEVEIFTESFEYGEEIVAPGYVAPEGYEFAGWDIPEGTTMGEGIPSEFVAELTPIGYKLTYVISGLPADKGINAPAEATGLRVGQDVTVEAAPIVEGYDFEGWFDANGEEYFADGTDTINMPAANVTLSGTYTAKSYTITFNSNGAEDIPSATYKCDEVVETLPAPTIDGYTFAGWYEGETKVDAGFKMPARNIALTAKWDKVVKYSIITLDANGGKFSNGAPVYPVKAEVGVPFNAVPENPTREGFEFIGWTDKDGNATSIPKVFPEEDVTIKAAWAEIYDVTYYDEDGTTVIKSFVDAGKEGANVPAIDEADIPQKDGYRFMGWEGMPEDGKIPAGNLSLVAKYEEIIVPKYTITYISNGATVNTVSYEEGAVIEEYNLNDVEGYTFNGWKPELPSTMPAENLTVEAVWDINEHDITLDANGGKFADGTGIFTDTLDYGTVLSGIIPANPTRDGYEFAGWDGELPSTMPDHDVSLKAKWELKEYTITFDSNGGSDVPAQKYKFGETVTAPADPTRDGFKFVKWNPALPETMPANDITVVAEWEAVADTKTLTIDANGGAFADGTDKKTETLAVGEEIKDLPVPTRDGYDFAGWSGIPEDGKMPAEDITITATWTPVVVPEHKVEYFYAVDGALYQTLTFKEGETIVHPVGPAVEGLTFKGWADENGNELPAIMGDEDLKAYAQYDFNKYKVTYIVDGSVYEEYEVLYQAEVPVPEDPADSATRLFAGWQPNVEDVMPAHDLTYTATWVGAPEPDEYTATFLRHDGETHAKYVLEEGDVIPVPAAPQRFGYVFVGWEPEVPDTMPGHDMVFKPKYEIDKTFVTIVIGGGVVIAGGAIAGSIIGGNIAAITGVSIVGGILVIVGVAELIKHTHTVTYIVDGEVYKTYKVVEGTKIPVPADPVKDGFTFEGWNPEVPNKMGKTDLVFEATWSEKAADDSSPDVDVEIPETGSVAGGLTAFAIISGAAAAAYVITRRKKED